MHRSCMGRDDFLWAQILAVIAFILSGAGWYLSWAAGLICVVILLLECCCDLPYELFTVAGVCAIIAAIAQFLAAAGFVQFGQTGLDIHADHLLIIAVIAGLLWVFAAGVALRVGGGCRRC